ncbi:TonB-dependent receptor plug domain-containing protein [Pedobacter nyackensis]|uniref:Iron complex outermembrane recepter protein n=1 Tax=Pedobacter nyackensis TaxID=475255 RepID=A0A1W2F049_9SPHI|nr:TonB-dependent receptor [Pedobacter nyackensis]SMD15274.1 iron complex outermembrane recepter protein [Pedobacter nyackensis]
MKKIYFALLMLLCGDLYAQKGLDTVIRIKEVVINENGFSTPISKQNRNVYVIDKDMIAKLPARTIQELLQYANGVDIRQRGPFGSQADISIDGGSFEQTVVLLNGAKIIDAQTSHNMLNLPIPVEAIERIEVVRGPAARIYGINSLTGAINIITKKPTNSGFLISTHAGSNFEKDSEGTGKTFYGEGIQLGAALSKKQQQHSIFGSYDKSNGYRYNTQFDNARLFYQGNIQIDGSNEIMTSFGYTNNEFGANGFYAAPGDKNSTEAVQTTLAAIQSKHLLSSKWTLMPRLSYRYNFDDYSYLGASNPTAGRSKHYTNSIAAEVISTYKTSTGEFGFGAEVRREDIRSSNIGQHHRENLGIYSQYQTYLFEKLNLNFGTYLNYNSDYKWQIYPGLDASYSITDMFKIIGNIGTSQRIPSFTDLYLNQRPGNIGNPNLEPENALQGELGFKIIKGNFTFNSNFFRRRISKFIDWTRVVNTNPWQSNNLGDQVTGGINMRSDYSMNVSEASKLNINLAYSYLDSKNSDTEAGLASKYQISSLKHQLTNTVNFQYINFSVMAATRFNQRVSGPSYWINDFRLSQSIQHFTIFLDAQNIFNTKYYEIGAIPLPSRWIGLGVKFVNF